MAEDSFSRYLLLPELRLLESAPLGRGRAGRDGAHRGEGERDGGVPAVRDAEHERVRPTLGAAEGRAAADCGKRFSAVRKRRFWCAACKKPFTEPLPGVRKGYRTTERYRRRLLWACEHFSDLKSVRATYRCSSGLVHRVLYEQLELKRRTRLYPWPEKVGIDEHLFKHDFRLEQRRFVTMVVDHKNKRLMELVEGKSRAELTAALQHIPGRENVRWVTLDMSDSYRSFARSFFPNAQLVADKFHVLRLLTPAIHRALRALNLPKEALPMYRVLRKNPRTLTAEWRWNLRCWLADKPVLRELCAAREAIFSLYRVRGHGRASKALTRFTDTLALSSVPELKTLRNHPHALASRGPGLFPLSPHQRPHRGLQRQGKARDSASLRV